MLNGINAVFVGLDDRVPAFAFPEDDLDGLCLVQRVREELDLIALAADVDTV